MSRSGKTGAARRQLAGEIDRPPTSPNSIPSAARLQLAFTRLGRGGQPTRTLHHSSDDGGSTMQCIGVDVSKQVLVTYDGERERVFPNRKELPHGEAQS